MSRSNKIRRQEKLRQLAKRAKERHEKRLGRQALGPRAASVVENAEFLIGRGRWDEARNVLEEHDRELPRDPRVLRLLLDVYHEQGDFSAYARGCQRFLELTPSDRGLQLALAGAYLSDARMATALRKFRRFVERWPNDPMSGAARATIAQLETALDEAMKDCPFPREDRVDLGAMHEEVMAGLQSDDIERIVAVGEQLMARSPDFIPVRNNLAELYFRSARPADAIALSRQVLEREPENFHALADLARYLLLTGQQQ
jgi:tetratricopeptide (TPR) repeat protein